LHIWRIPASASTKIFKTTVAWKTVNDTLYTPATEKYVTRRDTAIVNRESAVQVLRTQSRYGNTYQCPEFDLPGNIVAWSFYVGVNRQAQQVYQDAEQKFAKSNAAQSKMPGYSLLGAFALTGKSYFTPIQNDQVITYSIVDATNAALAKQQQPFKSIRQKKVTNDFSAMKDPIAGKCYFYLNNETDGNLDVMVKIAAVVVYERMEERPIQKMEC
jgi:hypothetical protein